MGKDRKGCWLSCSQQEQRYRHNSNQEFSSQPSYSGHHSDQSTHSQMSQSGNSQLQDSQPLFDVTNQAPHVYEHTQEYGDDGDIDIYNFDNENPEAVIPESDPSDQEDNDIQILPDHSTPKQVCHNTSKTSSKSDAPDAFQQGILNYLDKKSKSKTDAAEDLTLWARNLAAEIQNGIRSDRKRRLLKCDITDLVNKAIRSELESDV